MRVTASARGRVEYLIDPRMRVGASFGGRMLIYVGDCTSRYHVSNPTPNDKIKTNAYSSKAPNPSSSPCSTALIQHPTTSLQWSKSNPMLADNPSTLSANWIKDGERLSWRQCAKQVLNCEDVSCRFYMSPSVQASGEEGMDVRLTEMLSSNWTCGTESGDGRWTSFKDALYDWCYSTTIQWWINI